MRSWRLPTLFSLVFLILAAIGVPIIYWPMGWGCCSDEDRARGFALMQLWVTFVAFGLALPGGAFTLRQMLHQQRRPIVEVAAQLAEAKPLENTGTQTSTATHRASDRWLTPTTVQLQRYYACRSERHLLPVLRRCGNPVRARWRHSTVPSCPCSSLSRRAPTSVARIEKNGAGPFDVFMSTLRTSGSPLRSRMFKGS